MRANQKRIAIAGALVAVGVGVGIVLLNGDDGDDVPESRSNGADVTSGDQTETFRYPKDVRGVAGARTTFVNDDDVPHTFTSDDGLFDSDTVQPGGEFTIETLPAGTYGYHCSIHADLTGELEITD